jgi:hypothetical protein
MGSQVTSVSSVGSQVTRAEFLARSLPFMDIPLTDMGDDDEVTVLLSTSGLPADAQDGLLRLVVLPPPVADESVAAARAPLGDRIARAQIGGLVAIKRARGRHGDAPDYTVHCKLLEVMNLEGSFVVTCSSPIEPYDSNAGERNCLATHFRPSRYNDGLLCCVMLCYVMLFMLCYLCYVILRRNQPWRLLSTHVKHSCHNMRIHVTCQAFMSHVKHSPQHAQACTHAMELVVQVQACLQACCSVIVITNQDSNLI